MRVRVVRAAALPVVGLLMLCVPGLVDTASAVGTVSAALRGRTVSLAVSGSSAMTGAKVRFSGQVSRSPKGTTVLLQQRSGARWRSLATMKTTDKKGHFAYAWTSTGLGTHVFRAQVRAVKGLKAATSRTRTVVVRSRVVATLTASRATVAAGDPLVLHGSVRPFRAGTSVVLQSRVAGAAWRADGAAARVSGTGTYSFTRTPPAGLIDYRVVVSATSTHIPAATSPTVRVDAEVPVTAMASLSSLGVGADNSSASPSVSSDGRYVAYQSDADNLVAGDVNQHTDVFVTDMVTGVTRLVSAASDGTRGNGDSTAPSISADGTYVAYQSDATNLVSGDLNGKTDVFVTGLATGVTRLVSVASDGTTQGNGPSTRPSISTGGTYVAYQSDATNLVADDTNASTDVFVTDVDHGITRRVSVASNGTQGDAGSSTPSISADGSRVAYQSAADNLVPNDINAQVDVFATDLRAGVPGPTRMVSVATVGTENADGSENDGDSVNPSISADGRYVAYESDSATLIADDTDLDTDIFVTDLDAGVTDLGSGKLDGPGSSHGARTETSYDASISGDGRYVGYASLARLLPVGVRGWDSPPSGAPYIYVTKLAGH